MLNGPRTIGEYLLRKLENYDIGHDSKRHGV